MSKGVNKVMLIGNLGNDPEVRYMTNGNAVANIKIATSEMWKDKQTGENQERTEWHSIVFFNRLAEISGEYLRKGSKIYVEGSLKTRKWQDKDGHDRYTTEIMGSELQMLDSKPSTEKPEKKTEKNTQGTLIDAPVFHKNKPSHFENSSKFNHSDLDDDIPF